MILQLINSVGKTVLEACTSVGRFVLFFLHCISVVFTSRPNMRQILQQIERVGVGSFAIIFLTGASSGLALALQTYIGLSRFGGEEFLGLVVALGMTRELGPVLTGLMVTGRAGSAMAAELGTMQISEQIDALRTLQVNPYQYLVIPRILATTFILPFLATISMLCGIAGGFFYCVYVLQMSPDMYLSSIKSHVELSDITGGLFKSSVFGLILSWVGSYNGFYTTGGARGVGISTTRAVVVGSIMILIANYILSALLFKTGLS